MVTYAKVNGTWPDPTPVPTPQEAISGVKRLVRLAYRIAREEGARDRNFKMREWKYRLTSGRRYTYPRYGEWRVNPKGHHFGGWKDIAHDVSHWAHNHFWPNEGGHAPRHVWLEKTMVDYAVANFLGGQLRRPEKTKPNLKSVRAMRVASRIKSWEAKRRRAENALKKLRRQRAHYEKHGITA